MSLYTLFHPPVFQGRGKKKNYFEGWYFKMALPDEVIALIPGIALGEDRHAFIQVISSKEGRSWYVRFPFDAFVADKKAFAVAIGDNHFSLDGIAVDLHAEGLTLKAEIRHISPTPFPVSLRAPGIMGWYAYVPFMECFHGVVSTHHSLEGLIELNGRTIKGAGGTGYIEKDWGSSFPSAWIWMQANCFPTDKVACMLSVANIPFLGRTFQGFLGFLQIGEKLIRFGTYTGAKVIRLEQDNEHASVTISQRGYRITFDATLGPTSHLSAPRQGNMERSILESVIGTIGVTLKDREGKLLFQETGSMAGIELSEAVNLMPSKHKV